MRIKNNIKCLVLSLMISSGVVNAQDFSLKQAQDYAVEHYYESVNAGLDVQKSKAKIWEIIALGLPQVNAVGGYRFAKDLEFNVLLPPGDPGFLAAFAADNITQGKIEATQLIFDGSYIVGLQASKKYLEFSQVGKEKTDNDVRANVASSYYLVLISDENISVLDRSFENLEGSIKETKALVDQGFLDATELDQLELMKSDLESSLQSAKFTKEVAIKMLKLNMGIDFSLSVNLSDSLSGITEQIDLDVLLSKQFDQESNPDLKVLEIQRDLKKLDLKIICSRHIHDIKIKDYLQLQGIIKRKQPHINLIGTG